MRLLNSFVLVLLLASPVAAELASAITSPYLKVQFALAGDSTEGVFEAAEEIMAAAAALGDDGKGLAEAAGTLAAAGDIEAARRAFGVLSDILIEYADSVGIGELKVAYCPMADRSWIQHDGSISNPFFGALMLTCGSFTPSK
jgi:hypothetical protein